MHKPKNIYVVIAREVSVDAADEMTSIIKLIEKFGFGYNPAELKSQGINLGKDAIVFGIKYSVATSWHFGEKLKKDTLITFKLNVIDHTGTNRGGPEQEHLIPAGRDRANMHFGVEGLPVAGSGNYMLRAEMLNKDGEVLAKGEYPFIVELVENDKVNENNK